MTVAILWPTVLLVAHIYLVWVYMYVTRISYIRAHPPQPGDLTTSLGFMRYTEPVEMPANNLRNLFEMPVLYFALVPLMLITGAATGLQVVLAWGYLALRMVHSVIHIARGPIMARFGVYVASCAVLLTMWIGFAAEVLVAG